MKNLTAHPSLEKHNGHIVEMLVRKKEFSISEIARMTHVNRRSVYNWFNQKHLKTEIIYRIGLIIKHDFSVEFPDLFTKDDFHQLHMLQQLKSDDPIFWELPSHHVWKDRYIALLENYNRLLLDFTNFEESSIIPNLMTAKK